MTAGLTYAAPVAFAAFLWWFGTGLIFAADRAPARRFSLILAVATLTLAASVAAVLASRNDPTAAAAYIAFAAAIGIWGWLELLFLAGLVTGPRTAECPQGASAWERFWCAAATVAYHEIALLVAVTSLYLITLETANTLAFHVFAVLWVMRLSAKLNLFLGVPNYTDDLMPTRLSHMKSYFRRRPMNAVFPIVVTGGAVVAAFLVATAIDPAATDAERVSALLLSTLIGLAVLEHWFMVLPIQDAALWRWILPGVKTVKHPATRMDACWLDTRWLHAHTATYLPRYFQTSGRRGPRSPQLRRSPPALTDTVDRRQRNV